MARRSREANGQNIYNVQGEKLSIFPRILIVCEDTKSSKLYIEDFIQYIRLPSAKVHVISGDGSAPRNVVNTVERCIEEEESNDPYEYVFIVIDRDHHHTFDEAMDKFHTIKKNHVGKKFLEIISFPSFEVWILYHFAYSRAVMEYSEDVINKIHELGFDYSKSLNDVFEKTYNLMSNAIRNAKMSVVDSKEVGQNNPSTCFHILIESLNEIKMPLCIQKVNFQDIFDVLWSHISSSYESGIAEFTLDNYSFKHLQDNILSEELFKDALNKFSEQNSYLNIELEQDRVTIRI